MKETYKGCEVEIYTVAHIDHLGRGSFVIVAKQGYGGKDWRAYCGMVVEETDDDWQAVLQHGAKVKRPLAEFLFPDFAKKYRWRE
jgi:hypothetical protein